MTGSQHIREFDGSPAASKGVRRGGAGRRPRGWSPAVVVLAGWIVAGAGCATPARGPAWVPSGDALVDARLAVSNAPPRDRVLWQCRTAAIALRRGADDEARRLLDEVRVELDRIRADDPQARKARGAFGKESRKLFRGEPYERAMAYYYRGILFWKDGEADNARACFRNAQFQDASADDQAHVGDWVLCDYLDGLATLKLAGDGADALRRSGAAARLAKPPPADPTANVLIFAESGRGPGKWAGGEFGEQLRFQPGTSSVAVVQITLGTNVVRLNAYDDVTFQATTRGGRVMDHVLANKAVFKRSADAVGDVAILGGAVVAAAGDANTAADEIGLGLVAFGLLSKIIAASTTPAADTRCWDNLPNLLHFGAVRLPAGRHSGRVEFLRSDGGPITGAGREISIDVLPPPRDTVLFVSELRD